MKIKISKLLLYLKKISGEKMHGLMDIMVYQKAVLSPSLFVISVKREFLKELLHVNDETLQLKTKQKAKELFEN